MHYRMVMLGGSSLGRKEHTMQDHVHPTEDRGLPVIPLEDDTLHTTEFPFCDDGTCPCHEDGTLIAEVAQQVEAGLLTPEEASAFVAGHTL